MALSWGVIDWGEPARWRHRAHEFGRLLVHDGVPVMEYLLAAHLEPEQRLRQLWLALPPRPNLLDAVGESSRGLLLRYAAINWKHPLFAIQTPNDVKILARWGAQLTDVFRRIAAMYPGAELGHLCAPFLKIDLGDHVRVGFVPVTGWATGMPPEMRKRWPRGDERALIFVVGEHLARVTGTVNDRRIWNVIDRCREPKPKKRYESLDELFAAFENLGGRPCVRDETLDAWPYFERGMGWLALHDENAARDSFELALVHNGYQDLARWGFNVAGGNRERPPAFPIRGVRMIWPAEPVPSVPWTTAEADGLRHEAQRDFQGALVLYQQVAVDPANEADVATALARVNLQLGNAAAAADHARCALAADPSRIAARVTLVQALLARRDFAGALADADRLVLAAADDGAHHYLRGKALFGLGRLDEAREVFALATAVQPTLLEAMLMRREVERAIGAARRHAGTQGPIAIDVPASVRDVLSSDDPIAALADARFADDADAQLVLARLLAFDRQPERALAIYDRLAGMADPHRHHALVGKAGVLLDQGHLESALALFDLLCAEQPTDPEASEGRAHALERANRLGEAAAEFRRFLSLATSRSDVRVRSAQLWLDEHPL